MTRWLWLLWGAMIVSMVLKWQADTYMIIALIILPILIVLMDLHEEITTLKEENRHQRKFVLDRYNLLQERLKEMSTHVEKRMVVDFAELAKDNPSSDESGRLVPHLRHDKDAADKKEMMDFHDTVDEGEDEDADTDTYLDEDETVNEDADDFADI